MNKYICVCVGGGIGNRGCRGNFLRLGLGLRFVRQRVIERLVRQEWNGWLYSNGTAGGWMKKRVG